MITVLVELTEQELKAMEFLVDDPEQWIIDAAKNKALQAIELYVKESSDKQPEKLTELEKEAIVAAGSLETAKVRNILKKGV